MKIFDFSEYPELRTLFPELTSGQYETMILLSMGVPTKVISEIRNISYENTKKMIRDAKEIFEISSMTNLIAVIHIRCMFFQLSGYKIPQSQIL